MTDHTMTRAEFEAMYHPQPPERIYNWLDTQLSIARHYGGCTYQGVRYVIDYNAEGHPLVRVDVLQREAKDRKDEAKREREAWKAAQGDLLTALPRHPELP